LCNVDYNTLQIGENRRNAAGRREEGGTKEPLGGKTRTLWRQKGTSKKLGCKEIQKKSMNVNGIGEKRRRLGRNQEDMKTT